MTGCTANVPVYQHFNINPTAKIADGTSSENPLISGTNTPGITYQFGGTLTEGPVIYSQAQGWLTKQGALFDGAYNYYDKYGTITYTKSKADSPIVAGNQYCAYSYIYPASGYRAAGAADVGDQGAQASGCLTVTNKPYFKVQNSGVAADAAVLPAGGGSCTSGGGLLAGWNDNQDMGVNRGAGSQLSALALIKITGVASAQTTIYRSPTELTFANTNSGDISSSPDSPGLGGNMGGGPRCITPPAQAAGATDIGATVTAGAGNYTHTGNTKINGNSGVTGNSSVYVKGDVFINSNIKYNTSNWANNANGTTNIPSFTVVASGNIYIGKNVTELDGLYIARPDSSGSGGIIYTCGISSYQPCAGSNLYSQAKKQLVVVGSFIANQIRLYRTFGSLRDEAPAPGAPAGTQLGLSWSSAGPLSGMRCTRILETADPDTWNDNYLCIPNSSPVKLAWTSYAGNPAPSKDCVSSSNCSKTYLQANGYPYCTQWYVSAEPASHTWTDNYLCTTDANGGSTGANPGLNFSTTNNTNQYCTSIIEAADRDGNWSSGYFVCEPKAAPAGLPTSPSYPIACSNATGTYQSCAAEIFQLSPELYLSDPAVQSPSNGALQFDAISSLPPVL